MKTAMQELFDWIEETGQPINKELLLKIKELSFKEKEQIINAYSQGYGDGVQEPNPNDNYYNETHQNN